MTELNEPQRRAVLHANGPLLVFAGAGSGKTRVITYRIANLLVEHNVPPYRILAVTFTNKAAGEMRARLQQLAGVDVTQDLWVGTFHSVCARLLRRYHAEVGLTRQFVIYDDSDQKAVVSRILKERGLPERAYPPKQVLGRIHRQKRDGIAPDRVELGRGFDEELLEVYRRYEMALATANAVDFDDLLLKVLRLAETPNHPVGDELRSRFRHVLVDEFQDTNAIQYRLVRALSSPERNLCVVGDDDQSIYSWRGADVRNILDFKRDFPDALVVKLEQNYRSTKNIVSVALGVIKSAAAREPKNLWSAGPAGERVIVHAVRDEREEAARVVQLVRKEAGRGISLRDMAVFYRVHAMSRVLEETLRAEALPYQIVGGMKFFDRAEVKNLLAYLRLIDNPSSDADLMRIVNVPARGIGQKTLDHVLTLAARDGTTALEAIEHAVKGDGLAAGGKKKLAVFQKLIQGLRAEAPALSVSELADRALDETGYRKLLQDDDTAESDARLENLAELIGSMKEFEEGCAAAGVAPTLSGYLERVSLVSDVDSVKDTESLTLMTVHSAKGLEFSTVIVTGMEDETFPYKGLEDDSSDELDEERRLAYVAITRARAQLYITHASCRTLFGNTKYLPPSRFLTGLPEDAVSFEGNAWARTPQWSRTPPPAFATRGPAQRREPESGRYIDYDAFDDVAEERNVRPGDPVVHARFGRGVVESVHLGAPPTIVARFPGWGPRKVRADFLQFE